LAQWRCDRITPQQRAGGCTLGLPYASWIVTGEVLIRHMDEMQQVSSVSGRNPV
jgi:hypothetical protein